MESGCQVCLVSPILPCTCCDTSGAFPSTHWDAVVLLPSPTLLFYPLSCLCAQLLQGRREL